MPLLRQHGHRAIPIRRRCVGRCRGNTIYDVRMIMNCGECNMHMIGPDGVADSTDDAESVARDGLICQWNTRWTPSEGD